MDFKSWQRGRDDGLQVALKIVKESGVEGLEREIKYRGLTGIHTSMSEKELTAAGIKFKFLTIKTVLERKPGLSECKIWALNHSALLQTYPTGMF